MMRSMPPRGRRPRPPLLARIARPVLSLAVLAGGLLLAGAFVGIAVQGTALDRERDALVAEIAELERQRAEKEAEVARRESDEYVVDAARDLGYVRPGEGLIAVEGEPPQQAAVISVPELNVGRIARWLALFFGPR